MKHNRFSDFLYVYNDIILTIVIIALAALTILWRLNIIQQYPKTVASQIASQRTTEEPSSADSDDAVSSGEAEGSASDSATESSGTVAQWNADGTLAQDLVVNVPTSSQSAAIQSLVSAQIFANSEDWQTTCEDAGITSTTIVGKRYTFKKGQTKAEIAKQITSNS